VYDVGHGSHIQPKTCTFYLSRADAIIFLVPISAFDQALEEDPVVNCLEDSVHLWQSIVSNKAFQNNDIILFLNKCDLLKFKLKHGVKFADYVTSYGNRPNDFEAVSRYLISKFTTIHRESAPNVNRNLFTYLITVADSRIDPILADVCDMLHRRRARDRITL